MRGWILLAGTAMLLAACGKDNQGDDGEDLNQSLTAQNIVANDVTAIDAVTGDAANMAADVDFTDALANELDDAPSGNRAATSSRRPAPATRPTPERRAPVDAPSPATEPASNSTE